MCVVYVYVCVAISLLKHVDTMFEMFYTQNEMYISSKVNLLLMVILDIGKGKKLLILF